MRIIGITGGVGAGKSTVLDIIRNNCNCYIIMADDAAKEIEKKGHECYDEIVSLLGSEILDSNGEIDKKRMADKIFSDKKGQLLGEVNAIIHPQVKKHILALIETERSKGEVDFFFIEAALLIEDGYLSICDEMWYIYASEMVRTKRLMESRGYSLDKVKNIISKQNNEETFRTYCNFVIENNGNLDITEKQIKDKLNYYC